MEQYGHLQLPCLRLSASYGRCSRGAGSGSASGIRM
jgi:hypothetical protein